MWALKFIKKKGGTRNGLKQKQDRLELSSKIILQSRGYRIQKQVTREAVEFLSFMGFKSRKDTNLLACLNCNRLYKGTRGPIQDLREVRTAHSVQLLLSSVAARGSQTIGPYIENLLSSLP